ncbi:hypothetical protein BC831DRAFT_448153 [Entophlyctis helioformis]|nr:hypothetical protein BC831DRAFT_448153 [Entophlyctis helioformis]
MSSLNAVATRPQCPASNASAGKGAGMAGTAAQSVPTWFPVTVTADVIVDSDPGVVAALPSPRAGHTLTLDEVGGSALLFGGASTEDGFYNSLFKLELETATWSQVLPAHGSPVPPARYEHSAFLARSAAWGQRERLVIMFGAGANGPLNDMWTFNLETSVWQRILTRGSSPIARTLHSVALVKVQKPAQQQLYPQTALNEPETSCRAYVFGGGVEKDRPVDDAVMYCLDLDRLAWAAVNAPRQGTKSPKSRLGHSMCAIGRKVFVFGGLAGQDVLGDLWVFDTETNAWSQPATTGDKPGPRCGHSATAVGSKIVVYGGMAFQPHPCAVDDLFTLDTESWIWHKEDPAFMPPAAPGPRLDHDTCAMRSLSAPGCPRAESKLCVFGGMDFGNVYNDVFVLSLG